MMITSITNEEIFRPLTGNAFRFNCHKDISCFNECCAKLKLTLTPYDILRIKNRLELTSDVFLEAYTNTDMISHPRFPMVRLRMDDGEKGKCPFVTAEGCSIYEDRPGACRIYPIGRAARMMEAGGEQNTADKFFLVEESHCCGFEEEKLWTLEEWLSHEGVSEYNVMNDKWLEVFGSPKSLGSEETIQKKMQMFFMASYNLDRFRAFVFQSRFFDMFEVDNLLKDKMETDDVSLMVFAFDWLKFSLFGEMTVQPKA